MQMALGRRWVLELKFNVALRQRVDDACTVVQACVQVNDQLRRREMNWDRDRSLATMLSGWESKFNRTTW